jgi:hypothetical protein
MQEGDVGMKGIQDGNKRGEERWYERGREPCSVSKDQ